MTTIAETLAVVRKTLSDRGVPEPPMTLALIDQAQASFRSDLVSVGIDPAEEGVLEAALGGLVIGMKLNIQQQIPSPLISQYVSICECVLALTGAEPVDISDLPDPGFDSAFSIMNANDPEALPTCTRCAEKPAVIDLDGMVLCPLCAADLVRQGIAALRFSGVASRPRVGGPDFNRGPDGRFEPADVGPQSWWHRLMHTKIDDLLKRGKHRKR